MPHEDRTRFPQQATTRIGYEDTDRLFGYPQANNLSVS